MVSPEYSGTAIPCAPAVKKVTFAKAASVSCFTSVGNFSWLPAAPAQHYNSIERKWLMDTGCPYDLVCENSLQDEELRCTEVGEPILLNTANGL